MIERSFDATLLNDVANDPAVRPRLLGCCPIDYGPIIADPRNFALVTPSGGFVGVSCGSGDYEVHTQFRRGSRNARDVAPAAFAFMFERTDCRRLTTKVATANRAARALALAGGFTTLFHNPVLGVDCMELTIDRWAMACAALDEGGEWFHAKIEAAKVATGSTLPDHPHDAVHNRAVGAAVAMFRAGNPQKAAWFYNRWAAHAGYPGFTIIGEHPLTLDMGEAIVAIHNDDMEVLLCR